MTNHMTESPRAGVHGMRRLSTVAVLAFFFLGCGDWLKVTNPSLIQEEQLSDAALKPLIVNGVVGAFQNAYGTYVEWSSVLSDEAVSDHTTVGTREISLHSFNDQNGANNSTFVDLQRARQSADDAVLRIKAMVGAAAASDVDVARVLAYGGYAYVLLGEGFCEATVNLSPGLPPEELLRRAVAHFDSAIAIATAAKAGATGAKLADAQDILNMSSVGAARASLWLGNAAQARTYAQAVPSNYEKWAYYSSNSTAENNVMKNATTNPGGSWGLHPRFLGLSDPRVPQPASPMLGLNSNPIYPPQRPEQYSGWSPTTMQKIDIDTDVRFVSGLEAQYILAETDGPTPATLAFVNARRAVGNQAAVTLSGSALMDELRTQRSRDFYLTGQRLGDLRRYLKAGLDLFPTGMYATYPEPYGTQKCFIVPRSEKTGNPNY